MSQRRWPMTWFRPLAVSSMTACVAASLVQLTRIFVPDWNGVYVVAGCALASIEAAYSYRLLHARRLDDPDLLRFRAVEMALFFIFMRTARYIGVPWPQVRAEIAAWPREPWAIFDLEILGAYVIVLACWSMATQTTRDFQRIGEPAIRDKSYVPPLEALVARFFWGGAILLMAAGVTRIGLSSVFERGRPPVGGVVVNVLVYFIVGLLLLGEIQFAHLSQRWRKEGIDVPDWLAGHWVRYTLVLLVLTGAIASLLPTRYAIPLLDLAAFLVGVILYAFNVIFYLALLILMVILTPLARLWGGDLSGHPSEPLPPPQLPGPVSDGGPPAWLDVLRSVAFWACALGVVWYVIRAYLRDRPELTRSLASFRPLHLVQNFLRAVWLQVVRWVRAARDELPAQLRRRQRHAGETGSATGRSHRLLRLGGVSRRQRALRHYLSILRRAEREGFPRKRSQTPHEYDRALSSDVPEIDRELKRVTGDFVELRYSTHALERRQEERMRADSRSVRAILRSVRDARRRGGTKEKPGEVAE